ncbi:MAG: hypothetical protein A4E34_00613 [Methanoregula sp. PtaU1.Bin006]|nr:MAG: hypothetical protein A4E33_02444 [Methanoregula sp. PtaB.Bin085]OPY35613.1 MAG: hypothetical protein A4E34_00613 [Methanoregula sp. PtaU1.Bin006]
MKKALHRPPSTGNRTAPSLPFTFTPLTGNGLTNGFKNELKHSMRCDYEQFRNRPGIPAGRGEKTG